MKITLADMSQGRPVRFCERTIVCFLCKPDDCRGGGGGGGGASNNGWAGGGGGAEVEGAHVGGYKLVCTQIVFIQQLLEGRFFKHGRGQPYPWKREKLCRSSRKGKEQIEDTVARGTPTRLAVNAGCGMSVQIISIVFCAL